MLCKELTLPHSAELEVNDVLAVSNLTIHFHHEQQQIAAVRDLSFTLQRGETLAIVGSQVLANQ